MASTSTVHLLEVEPDLARFLTEEERESASRVSMPVVSIAKGTLDVAATLHHAKGFGALVLDGMLLERLQVGDQVALRLLGPGDIIFLRGAAGSALLASCSWRVPTQTRLAVLGNELLIAAHHWPRLTAGLYVRLGEQSDRLAAQLAICQLPRVDQRVLALMWLLSETWGQVTSAGTALPLMLTHDTIGGLIGARRPTVTLALGDLSERGAIVRQDCGWLLLEDPPQPSSPPPRIEDPALLAPFASSWSAEADHESETASSQAALRAAVSRLRQEHLRNVERFSARLGAITSSRERCSQTRLRVARQAVTRQRVPSSG